MRLAFFLCASCILSGMLPACSSEGTPAPSSGDDGGGPGGSDRDAGGDANLPTTSVRCTQAEFDHVADPAVGGDYTADDSVTITFPLESKPAQYTNRCIKVKVGAEVTFTGDFSRHPLEPSGGDTPTPIPNRPSVPTGSLSLTMSDAGTFGFECGMHPTIMFGAVQVVP